MTRILAVTCAVGVCVGSGCIDLEPSQPKSSPKPPAVRGLEGLTGVERVPATADTVGTKGKDYGGGIITEPIRQRFRIENDVLLKLVNHAMQLYSAEHGRYPASHDEFMKSIIEANAIRLPPLPPGQHYVYDPETHTLMVERPKP